MSDISAAPDIEAPRRKHDHPPLGGAKLSTRLAFFIAGFGLACWAPLVPYAKARLGATEAELGTILLFLGIGSVVGMPAAGHLAGRLGNRAVVIGGAIGVLLCLPLLAMAGSVTMLGAVLFVFGASLGGVDVAANMHGTVVQERARQPLMSNFHSFYSIGGLVGAAGITLALSAGMQVAFAAIAASVLVGGCLLAATTGFLTAPPAASAVQSPFVKPHGIVVLIGAMTGLTFLAEGAVLDWGAILLSESKNVSLDNAGVGYSAFALAMTLARIVGDRFVAWLGNLRTLAWGALITAAGIALAAWTGNGWISVAGFAITGLGAANIVPVLFTLAGAQKAMPAGYAIAAVSTLGYLGVFLGPALVGHIAAAVTLPLAFGMLAILMVLVAGLSGAAVKGAAGNQRSRA